jgi:hypothetical protein
MYIVSVVLNPHCSVSIVLATKWCEMTDDLVCPICGTKAKPLDDTGDYTGYQCLNHGSFRVAGTIKAPPAHNEASEKKWEKALERAKERAPGAAIPTIKDDDFDDYG